jgi:hypothetical protein
MPRDGPWTCPDGFLSCWQNTSVRPLPKPCPCHGFTYVFRGQAAANGADSQVGAKLADVARRSGVSTSTVSTVLNHPGDVALATRDKVMAAIAELGYVRGGSARELAPHWRRSGFASWLFQPAATGWYPSRGATRPHPVPLVAEPWPGVPVRGRNASGRADACWMPIARGLTPHGLRHTHKTLMEELGTPPKLMDERMGHEDGSMQSRYTHVTSDMRRRLLEGLANHWEASLMARGAMNCRSSVSTLDRVLQLSTTDQGPTAPPD